ncbi:hypothetical protein [Cyanobium sp. ATX 6F1]|uniref:hypothetical protein n=1 Tax=Cyanobium sp. ATX 6F1 TaxID=2823702 RepID=UPI0020CDA7AE|nr:hypothetical protein [Cyanobium sp. ATX 6F1]MCP9915544.1 hypothetical protein [Cyanobium sp. ATX 6F1]
MTCGLIRIRCERRWLDSRGKNAEAPAPDHRVFDVPPGMANQIARWYRQQGWEVIEEPI